MKKITLLFLFASLTVFSLFLIGCAKETELMNELKQGSCLEKNASIPVLDDVIENYDSCGVLHNNFLENAYKYYTIDTTITSIDSLISSLTIFNESYLARVTTFDKWDEDYKFNEFEDYYYTSNLCNELSNTSSLYSSIDYLHSASKITTFEKIFLLDLLKENWLIQFSSQSAKDI